MALRSSAEPQPQPAPHQAKLSAFAGASLWVVIGVSADNIFVLSETWGQSAQLERDGAPARLAERLSWTVRQAGVPLFFANATTAASLFINCFSSLPAIFQFGLCGGVLLFVNMALSLTYLPALLVLQERGVFDRAAGWGQAAREAELRRRMLLLQALPAPTPQPLPANPAPEPSPIVTPPQASTLTRAAGGAPLDVARPPPHPHVVWRAGGAAAARRRLARARR